MRACAILCWLWLIGSIRIEEPSFGTFRKAKVKGSMTDAQLESIFFYVRNDYLILNNLMWGNLAEAFRGAEIANMDAKGMMEEAQKVGPAARWRVSQECGEKIYAAYQRRTFDRLDASTKQKILCRAKADIRNLFFCMEPLEAELTVWRNVPESLCAGHSSGQQLDWQAFSSTSLFPHDDSYHRERRFVRYCLQLPAGMPVLRMERLSEGIRNEADEVLLPPVRGIVSQARSGLADCVQEVALAVHEWRIWFCAEDALGVRES